MKNNENFKLGVSIQDDLAKSTHQEDQKLTHFVIVKPEQWCIKLGVAHASIE